MDLNNMTLFQMMDKRMKWLSQRQSTIAGNIANANTPGYQAKDLKPQKFKELLSTEASKLPITKTNPKHLSPYSSGPGVLMTNAAHQPGTLGRGRDFKSEDNRKSSDVTLDENNVVLENELFKMNEVRSQYDTTLSLYKKQVRMLKTAIGKK